MDNLFLLRKEDLEEMLRKVSLNADVREPMRKSALNVNEAVKYLNDSGFKISKSTMYKYTMEGTIPFQRFGKRRLVFRTEELDEWLDGKIANKTDDIAKNVAKSAKRKGR